MNWKEYTTRVYHLVRDNTLSPDLLGLTEVGRLLAVTKIEFWDKELCFEVAALVQPYREALEEMGYPRPPLVTTSDVGSGQVSYEQHEKLGEVFCLNLPIDKRVVDRVKAVIPKVGREFDFIRRVFYVHVSYHDAVSSLAYEFGWSCSRMAIDIIRAWRDNFEHSYATPPREAFLVPLNRGLVSHEQTGIEYAARVKRAILADDELLGKGVQAMGTVQHLEELPVLILCPKALVGHWEHEVGKWTNWKTAVYNNEVTGRARGKLNTQLRYALLNKVVKAVICHYQAVPALFNLQQVKVAGTPVAGTPGGGTPGELQSNSFEKLFKAVIVDESHNVRNVRTDRHAHIKYVLRDKKVRLLLTSTPIVNGPEDLAAQLDLLGYLERFGGYQQFCRDYSQVDYTSLWNNSRNENPQNARLNDTLRSLCMIRREAKDEGIHLPEVVRKVIRTPLSNAAEYRSLEAELGTANGEPVSRTQFTQYGKTLREGFRG